MGFAAIEQTVASVLASPAVFGTAITYEVDGGAELEIYAVLDLRPWVPGDGDAEAPVYEATVLVNRADVAEPQPGLDRITLTWDGTEVTARVQQIVDQDSGRWRLGIVR